MGMNGQLFYSFLFSVKLTKLKWSESFWTIQVQWVVNLFLCSSFRQTGLGSNFKLRNKPQPLYSVTAWGLWVFLAKLKKFKTIRSLHIIHWTKENIEQLNVTTQNLFNRETPRLKTYICKRLQFSNILEFLRCLFVLLIPEGGNLNFNCQY